MKYKRESAVTLGYINIVKYAESFGAHGFKVNHADEFLSILQTVFSLDGQVLIEIPIDYADNKELFETVNPNVGN